MNLLAGSIAHELNQPLTAIVNYARGCLRRLASGPGGHPELLQAMQCVADEAHRAGAIIRRLRELAANRPPTLQPDSLNEAIRQAVFISEPLIRGSDAQVTLRLAERLPPARFDRLLIVQVLLNLIKNGLEAMEGAEAGLRELTIESRVVDSTDVEVSVHDRGSGLSPERIVGLFKPFHSSKPGGMGLGLTVSKSIVELHGGQMWATPREGRGTSFHVRLPASAPEVGS